jgi:phage tail sheath protein FI
MPALSYPGVYVEEVPTGARPILGVGTSVAAFVGSAPRGPVDRAERVTSFHEFVRGFGGLDARSFLGYSVQHFFANGGREACIVRLASDDARSASVTLSGALKVEARSPGAWGNDYAIEIRSGPDPTRFGLDVWHMPSRVVVESFDDLSILAEDRRFVTSLLESESSFVAAAVDGSPTRLAANTSADAPAPLVGGEDGDTLVPNTPAFERKLDPAAGPGGLSLLDGIDFNILCVPGETNATALTRIQQYCRDKRAFAIVDSAENTQLAAIQNGPDPALTGAEGVNSAIYFPWVTCADPLQENRPRDFPPCGFVAGIYARTDGSRGVWKAPAGSEAAIIGAAGVALPLTDAETRTLNARGINCIRTLEGFGTVVWGSRTLGDASSEWRYVQVRRLFSFVEESISRGTRWVVFEPNDEPLWVHIRRDVTAFLHDLFDRGAFQGTTPREAYFVKCGKDTTTQDDVDRGAVNIVVGFAPTKPAEFVVIEIQQIACKPANNT